MSDKKTDEANGACLFGSRKGSEGHGGSRMQAIGVGANFGAADVLCTRLKVAE